MSNIPSTPVDGNYSVLWVPAIANIASPKVSELTGGTAKQLACYLTGSGYQETIDQASIADERLCDTFSAEQPGRVSVSLELEFIDNTGTALSSTSNDAATTLVPGTVGFVVTRRGKAFDSTHAAADVVSIRKVVVGKHRPVAPEANTVQRSLVKLFVQDYKDNVAVVSGA